MIFGNRGITVLPGRVKAKVTVQPGEIEPDPTEPGPGEDLWETLPLHPAVMAETTFNHRLIKALGVSDGVMLLGYGDWAENLGPVKVIGYDLVTLLPVTLMEPPHALGSEAWDIIRIIDGKAYLPHTDPTLGNQGAYTTTERGFWETVEIGGDQSMIHTFDVVKFKGRMMACGSMYEDGVGAGVVYTETEPGSREFAISLLGDSRGPGARFYTLSVRDEGNEVMVQNYSGGLESFVTTDGDNWTAAPSEPPVNSSTPGPLPTGYTNHGVELVSAVTFHDGWVWVGGSDGVVKRALLTP